MTWRLPLIAVLGLALAACASNTPYQPAADDGLGYVEQKLESGRYRVTFTAGSGTAVAQVDNYLLYRAAELTLANGYDYFVVTDRSANGAPRSGSGVSIGVGGYGGSYGSGIGIGFGTGVNDRPWQASMSVVMFKGSKPADDANAYEAQSVIGSLKGQVQPSAGGEPSRSN